jgi:hypothetical protein
MRKQGHEFFYDSLIPYYDVERKYKTNSERSKEWKKLMQSCYSMLADYYGPDACIITFDASGKTDDTQYPYKNSYHFLVRGVGFYRYGNQIPKFTDPMDKTLWDNAVYRGKDARGNMRLPYCSKNGKTRLLKRVLNVLDEPELVECIDDIPEDYALYLISNVAGERLVPVVESKEQEEKSKPSTLVKSGKGLTHDALRDLVLGFATNENQELPWQDWWEMCCMLANEGSKYGVDFEGIFHEFSALSKRYNKHATQIALNSAWRWDTNDKKKIGIGTVLKKLKEDNPEAFKTWMCKYGMSYTIDPADDYVYLDFYNYYSETEFESFDQLCETFFNDANRVLARCLAGSGLILKKDNCEEGWNAQIKEMTKCIDFDIKYYELEEKKEKKAKKDTKKTTKKPPAKLPKKLGQKQPQEEEHDDAEDSEENEQPAPKVMFKVMKTVRMSKLVWEKLNRYSAIVCEPDGCKPSYFNTWRGFQAKKVDTVNMELIQPMLEFIDDVWACNVPATMHHLMSWLALLVQKPGQLLEIALFIWGKQGCGKSTLIDFLVKFILGDNLSLIQTGINGVVQKHNTHLQGRRLCVINEMCSTREEFRSNFDNMKDKITGDTLMIEPKGLNPYKCKNTCNFIMISNNRDALYVDGEDDRRYACMEMSEKYIGNHEYFEQLRAKCFNQECADHFYTYLLGYKPMNIKNIPKTALKTEIKEISRPSYERFAHYLKGVFGAATIPEEKRDENYEEAMAEMETLQNEICIRKRDEPTTKVRAKDLFACYSKWCAENGERNVLTSTKFGLSIKRLISFSTTSIGGVYDLSNFLI